VEAVVQLGELVNVEMPEQDAEEQCPFSHKKPNPDEKNVLGGIGTDLGKNMAKGVGIHTKKPPVGADYTGSSTVLDPRDRKGKHKLTYLRIKVDDEEVTLENGDPVLYPVTCAAHHLVPAQESLKDHPILRYMCKNGEDQDFRSSGKLAEAPVSGSKVWGNVAYNVNGGQNGVWLPGNYAVGAAIGGVEIWKSRAKKRTTFTAKKAAANWEEAIDLTEAQWIQLSVDPEEDEEAPSLASAVAEASGPEYMLVGKNYSIDKRNPKWGYVKAAMDEAGGQFHDRHKQYSDEVQTYLKKINAVYNTRYDTSTEDPDDGGCKKCVEARRPAKAKADLVGPPYNIVTRLKDGSDFFRKFVQTQKLTATNIYTSEWVAAFMATKKKR
jgi:hypothetical protein